MKRLITFSILLLSAIVLPGCGSGGDGDPLPVTGPPPPTGGGGNSTPSGLSLSLSRSTVRSANLETSVVTATVLDANNAVIKDQLVRFSADGGAISASEVQTDVNGQAKINFSSGPDNANKIVTISASAGSINRNIPVQIVGSTLEATSNISVVPLNGLAQVTVTVRDAAGTAVYDAPITANASSTDTGRISVFPSSANTNNNGQSTFSVTGVNPGTSKLTIQGLGVTQVLTFNILDAVGSSDFFRITAPAEDAISVSTNTPVTIQVSAPLPTTSVIFSTTLGTWDGGTSNVVTKSPVDGAVSAQISSNLAGLASIQILDAGNPLSSDTMTIAFSAAAATASNISLQSSATVMPPSSSTNKNEVRLTATVTNSSGQVVGGAPVVFSVDNPTGGGETISPVITYTDSSGQANAVFTSGSLPSNPEGVSVTAKLVQFPDKKSTVSIIVGGTAGSILIGRSTTIQSISNDTAYSLPMSVLVADSSGGPVTGATVSLSVWPVEYFANDFSGFYPNEDVNENLVLDHGEDRNGDKELTPPAAAAGNIPSSVTTDSNGLATFNFIYLKQSAANIKVRIRASTRVQGTETLSSTIFILPIAESDVDKIPDPPWAPPQ